MNVFRESTRRKSRVDQLHRLQAQTVSLKRQCSVLGGIKNVLFVMNISNLIKLSMLFGANK